MTGQPTRSEQGSGRSCLLSRIVGASSRDAVLLEREQRPAPRRGKLLVLQPSSPKRAQPQAGATDPAPGELAGGSKQ